MLCANPDLIVHIGDQEFICAGTYAKFYEDIGGKVSYHGKPYPHVYEMALRKLGNPAPHRVCAMGDALRTDVAGANRMGFHSIWSLCGVHWQEVRHFANSNEPCQDRIDALVTESPFKPDACIHEFKWHS